MATDPRAVHWPKRDVRHASYLAVTPLTNPAVLISHCTANDESARRSRLTKLRRSATRTC